MSEGLPELRESSDLHIKPPASITDAVCEALKRPLLKVLLQRTITIKNEASKVLKMYKVGMTYLF